MKLKLCIVLVLGFFCVELFSQTNSVFVEFKNKMSVAKELYKKNNYLEAFKVFENIVKIAPDNEEANFYLGRCALELKNYDVAMAAFDRVLILNPNHTRTKLEIARIYFELKQYDLALTQLDLVLKEDIPESVKRNVLVFKANIEKSKKRHFVYGSITVGADYDSNANNDIGDKEFNLPLFNLPIKGKPKQSDSAIFLSTSISSLYYFEKFSGLSISNKLSFYTKFNNKISTNNPMSLSLASSLSYINDRHKVGFPISVNKVFLDKEGYSHSFAVGLRYEYALKARSSLGASFGFQRTYNEQDSNLDSKQNNFSVFYKNAFGKNPVILDLATSYARYYEISNIRTDINRDVLGYSIRVSKNLISKLNGSLAFGHTNTKYKELDVLFLNKREDRQNNFSLNLSYSISKSSLLGTTLSYTKNKSNQAPFNYDKTQVRLYFVKSF